MSFFTELKRRNVFKVGVAYAIVAWLLTQIIVSIEAPLHLPDWADTFIIVLLIAGFPIAVFLAWAYELTPDGVKVTTPEGPAHYHTRTTGHRLNYLILTVLALAVGFLLVDRFVLVERTGTATVASVTANAPVTSTGEAGVRSPGLTQSSRTPPSDLLRLASLNLGATHLMPSANLDAFVALSRDGHHLVYAAVMEEELQLYHRPLDQLTAQPIAGTHNAFDVFFSPDGKWVIFEGTGRNGFGLYKTLINGGAPQLLTVVGQYPRGAFWSADDIIYFIIDGKLSRISANGGTPTLVELQREYADLFQAWPEGLPGGSHLLITVHESMFNARDGHTALVSLATGETRILIHNAFHARYVPTGHIVFMRTGSLWAVPFDASSMQITGPEVPVVNGIQTSGGLGQAVYAFSDAGFLIYLPGGDVQGNDAVIVEQYNVDRMGNETLLDVEARGTIYEQTLSPNGEELALSVGGFGLDSDLWTFNLGRGALSRRTFSGDSSYPLWSPDGERLAYGFWPTFRGLSWVKADGTGQPESLINEPRNLVPNSFTPDGLHLVFHEEPPTGPIDLYLLSVSGERTVRPLLATEFSECCAAISPDGQWIAYQSNETGDFEIYIRPFPEVEGGKWQISIQGGREPRWRGDSKELYYLQQVGTKRSIIAVSVDTNPRFRADTPEVLFSGDYQAPSYRNYEVSADGEHFILFKVAAKTGVDTAPQMTSLVLVENWFGELKRLAPPSD